MSSETNQKEEPFFLIIDGSSLLSTQFYGNLPREIMFAKTVEEKEQYYPKIMQTSQGVYTNAVYGFLRVMLKIIKDQKPAYIAVAWDISRDTFRREMYPEYKGNRGETIVPLKDQFRLCQEVLKEMNIPQFMDERYEADDFSGSLCSKFEDTLPIRIMTKDNDYLQLVSDKTRLWLIHSTAKKTEELYKKYGLNMKEMNVPDRTFEFTPELVKEEFGILPSSVPSLKGLQGDSSDNIKGVPGVGETTAVLLVKEYETVDRLYAAIRDLDEAGKKEIVEYWKSIGIKRSPLNFLLKESDTELVGEKAAYLSEQLATIKRDIDLSKVTLDDLKVSIDKEKTQRMFELLEFHSLNIDKMLGNKEPSLSSKPGSDKVASSKQKEVGNSDENLQDKNDSNETSDVAKESASGNSTAMNQKEQVSLYPIHYEEFFKSNKVSSILNSEEFKYTEDFSEAEQIFAEISRMNERKEEGKYAAFSLIHDAARLIGLSLTYETDGDRTKTIVILVEGFIQAEYLIDKLNALIAQGITLCTIDLKNQLGFIRAEEGSNIDDIAIAAYLCDPVRQNYEYADIAEQLFGINLEGGKELLKKNSRENLLLQEKEKFVSMAGYESAVAYAARDVLRTVLEKYGMEKLYLEVELPLIYTLYDMQTRGIRVNREELREYGNRLAGDIARLEKSIYELAGEEFNINSPKQLGVILFEHMNLPFGKKTKTGYSTSVDVLDKLRTEHPIVSKILEYRQLTKLKSTYADGLDGYIKEDGRIHGIFNQTVTATGRISSTDPNLQNIPIRMELGRQIRKVFIPEEGYVFLDADYSQIELRVLAHMSSDERLIEAYQKEMDIHRLTASQVFHIPFDEVTSTQRSNAKAVNFGIVYGISAFSLGQDLNISRSDAEDYINKYFATYPNVKTYLEEQVELGRQTGIVTTMFGRIRPVPDLTNTNFMKRSAEERIAMNSPIQGTAADIIKIAMIRVNEELKKRKLKSRLLLQIHDELLVETEASEVEQVKEIMVREMMNAAQLQVPLIAEVNEGKNWYDAK